MSDERVQFIDVSNMSAEDCERELYRIKREVGASVEYQHARLNSAAEFFLSVLMAVVTCAGIVGFAVWATAQ